MEGKGGKSNGLDLGALERDVLEYPFSKDDDGEVDGNLLLMTPLSFMSPTRKAPASLSPVDPIGLAMDYRSRDIQKLLHDSPRRRRIDETMKVYFLSTLPESTLGTQYVMKVELNQPIMREVLEKNNELRRV